ncbi:MAG: hypothetical protein IPK69_13230 [Phycisphaerales bacterium]|nr:MAG: hypothetical protein IPK69_13230 [Phycisphaerales bacterium]
MQTTRHARLVVVAGGLAMAGVGLSAEGALTLLPLGPQLGTHAGNLVTGGSFEAGPPSAVVLWATGTTGTPFAVPPGWTSSGGPSNYARWGHDSTSPLNIANSAVIPDGVKALYFGNAQGGMVNMLPTFTPGGEVTFAGTPTVGTSFGPPVVLSQTINTHLSPAPSYLLSFWVSGENAIGGGAYDGIFGLRVTNTQAGDPMRYFAAPAGGGLSLYGDQLRLEFNFTPLNPSLPVTVEFYNWGHFSLPWGGTTELVLDDVIVNAIPAPASAVLVGAGGGVLAFGRRRQK